MSLKRFIKPVACVSPRTTVADACREMKEKNVGAIFVVSDDEKPIGVLTDRDIVVRAVIEGEDPKRTAIEEVMTSPVACLPLDATLDQATALMCARTVRRVPWRSRE